MNTESHSAISTILRAGAEAAQVRKDDLLLAIVAAAGSLQQMVLILQSQVENAPSPTITNNDITVNGSLTLEVVGGKNGDRIYHGFNLPDILVSAKDSEGYQDPYTSGKADGPDYLILRTPGNEEFNGTLVIDKVQTIQP